MFSIHRTAPAYGRPNLYWQGFERIDRIGDHILRYVWSPCLWASGRRKEANFEQAYWGALDFDDGTYDLITAKSDWAEYRHLIGTTKSHQKEKPPKGRACDRFRLLFQWSEPITDLRIFRWNMGQLVERFGADPKCIDGARFYWPCTGIESVVDTKNYVEIDNHVPDWFERKSTKKEYLQEVSYKRENYSEGGLPPHIHRFLYHGQLFGSQASRNVCCYTTARFLFELGYSDGDVMSLILASPFTRDGFSDREIRTAVASAGRSVTSRLNGAFKHEGYRRRQGASG